MDSLIGDVDTLTGKVETDSFKVNGDASLTDFPELVTSTPSPLLNAPQTLELEQIGYGSDRPNDSGKDDLMNIFPVAVSM